MGLVFLLLFCCVLCCSAEHYGHSMIVSQRVAIFAGCPSSPSGLLVINRNNTFHWIVIPWFTFLLLGCKCSRLSLSTRDWFRVPSQIPKNADAQVPYLTCLYAVVFRTQRNPGLYLKCLRALDIRPWQRSSESAVFLFTKIITIAIENKVEVITQLERGETPLVMENR